jgi:hypothetical protein
MPSNPRLWCLSGFLALLMALIFSQGAYAVGPYSHLRFARQFWPQAAASVGLDPKRTDLLPALYAGSLAPDAPYYPGAESRLATLVHVVRPWDFCRALLDLAETPQDKAFALGWVSHALLDVRTHEELVNRLAKGVYNNDRLLHKQIEWGLECWLLVQPESAWLWNPPVDVRAGLDLWNRALQKVYGAEVPEIMLLQAQEAQMKEVARLPYVWWWSGRLERQGHDVVNTLGWAIGETLRPAYVAYLNWRDIDMNVRAVLNPRKPDPQDTKDLLALMQKEEGHLLQTLAGGPWPGGGLDADASCVDDECKDGREALEWLRSPGPKGGSTDKIK